jgi:DUF4097 and DUF4098 domain-containing protein YvlB
MLKTTTFAAFALSATLLLGACESIGGPRYRDGRNRHVAYTSPTPLEIINANGAVRALHEDRADIAIEAELFGNDEQRLSFANLRADRQGDGTLRVWIEWPGGRSLDNEGASINVYLPDSDGVRIRTSNGSITTSGLSGVSELRSSNGAVHVEDHRGSVDIKTSNGSTRVEHAHGPIKIETSNGRVIVTEARAGVEAESTNGSMYVSTSHDNDQPVRVRTSNGRIELDLGEAFMGRLKIKTTNGTIRLTGLDDARLVESSDDTLEITVGGSDQISAAHTTNGSVRVTGREDPDPRN